jgi:uncharacterized protein YndB with AHSA1/START domain
VVREVAAPVQRVWDTLTDWPSHGRWVPMTTVRTLSDLPGGVGARFVARSGLGPLGFDDPMTVTTWQPPTDGSPGRCEFRKTGRVVEGFAAFTMTETSPGRTRLEWTEAITVVGVRRVPGAELVSRVMGRAVFGRAVARAAAEAESASVDRTS